MTSPTTTITQKFLSRPQELGVVAVGFSDGQPKAGVDAGPTALLEAGLLDQVRDELGYKVDFDSKVHDYADVKPAESEDPRYRNMIKPRTVSAVTRQLSEQVYEHAREGKMVLTLGGRPLDRHRHRLGHRQGHPRAPRTHGIGRVVEMALAHIGNDTPIHLSFDVDALDPQWAPSTGTPVRGGLTLREGDFIAECIHATGNLIAMDLVEVNPSLASMGASETVRAGCSLVRCALGDTLL
ncbi:arginase [Trichophyton equinum CBS 127.97]|uniref:Arginase n=1 Tax=Trichophyton equinum (strain ATCC MYA-4606 / CBS 127.97) TaxID=559882 RepID=F2PHT7_TRIEC|nr:arginase [Trichophyton equinum CBS 127.97]